MGKAGHVCGSGGDAHSCNFFSIGFPLNIYHFQSPVCECDCISQKWHNPHQLTQSGWHCPQEAWRRRSSSPMESQSLTTIEPNPVLTEKITSSNPPFIQKLARGNLLLTQSPPSRLLFSAFANIETTAWWWPSSKITNNIPLCSDILLNTTPVLQNIFKSRNNHENFTSGELFDCYRVKLRPSPSGNVSKAGQPIKDNPWHKRAQLRDTCLSTVRGTDASTRYVILVIFCAQYLTYTYKDRNE